MYVPAPNDKQFQLTPAGTHLATCYRVIDLGTQMTNWKGTPKRQHKILVSWELPDELMDDGRPFSVSRSYTWSMSDKATLRKDLESWRGVAFTEKDFGPGGFDIKNILGKSCLINVVHTDATAEGKQFANIASISKLMKGQKAPDKTVNDHVYLWLNSERWDSSVFNKLSDNIKGKILMSPEYAAMANEGVPDYDQSVPDVDADPDDSLDAPF